jgi:hypothetical protein
MTDAATQYPTIHDPTTGRPAPDDRAVRDHAVPDPAAPGAASGAAAPAPAVSDPAVRNPAIHAPRPAERDEDALAAAPQARPIAEQPPRPEEPEPFESEAPESFATANVNAFLGATEAWLQGLAAINKEMVQFAETRLQAVNTTARSVADVDAPTDEADADGGPVMQWPKTRTRAPETEPLRTVSEREPSPVAPLDHTELFSLAAANLEAFAGATQAWLRGLSAINQEMVRFADSRMQAVNATANSVAEANGAGAVTDASCDFARRAAEQYFTETAKVMNMVTGIAHDSWVPLQSRWRNGLNSGRRGDD